jgi:hypothetical protein
MRPTFEQTVDVLVKAFLNDTLMHGNCFACAVGNLVASGLGCAVIRKAGNHLSWSNGMNYPAMSGYLVQGWGAAFTTDSRNDEGKKVQEIDKYSLKVPIVKEQIKATGYKWQELAKIEFAFEAADYGSGEDEWMFNGLMAVVDVLAEIHNVDLSEKESAKSLFIKDKLIV